MGMFVVPVFDTIIAAVSDAETGSASGALNAIQQLGGGIGVAVLGTIFFSVLRHAGFAAALRHTMWWQVGVMALLLVLSPLCRVRLGCPTPGLSHASPRPRSRPRTAWLRERQPGGAPRWRRSSARSSFECIAPISSRRGSVPEAMISTARSTSSSLTTRSSRTLTSSSTSGARASR
jgi:hypothetical protein